jgi:hypothetical protein
MLEALGVVAGDPGEWYRVKVYKSGGGASSAANRASRVNWNEKLDLKGGDWEFVGRRVPEEGVSVVYARYIPPPVRVRRTKK